MTPTALWTDAIRARKSVRTYNNAATLSERQLYAIANAISEANKASCGKFTCCWAPTNDDSDFRPSTYGTIKGAAGFIPVAFDINDSGAALLVGQYIERLALSLTQAGIGTCWIGGTFKASSFSKTTDSPSKINIVIACGIAADKQRLRDRITQTIFKCASRKPFDSLFTQPDNSPIQQQSAWRPLLEAMRLAPSAINAQPWRVVVDGNVAHIFGIIRNGLNFVDLGIGLEHIVLSAQEKNLTITNVSDASFANIRKQYTYICSIAIPI